MRSEDGGVVCQDGFDQLETEGLGEGRDAEVLWPLAFGKETDVIEDLTNQRCA